MKFLPFLFACLISLNAAAQNGATVSGHITDGSTKENLSFATVAVINKATGVLLSGAVCDEDGRFQLTGIPRGEYTLSISFIGYQAKEMELLVGELNKIFDLGTIELMPVAEQLDEVTIEAQRSIISRGMEMKTFDLTDNIAQSGGSILDAMKTLPGITIDQEGKVILRGSDKVIILIDGKQSSLTGFGSQKGLDNIPASNVESIEIINNPSAKYDASGMAGIINILYKKEKETGFNMDAGMAYGLGAITKPKKDLPNDLGSYNLNPKYIPSLNMNYRTRRMNFFLQPEMMILNGLPNNEFTTRYYDDGRVTASQVPENRTQKHYIVIGGMDFYLNEQNTLTLSGIYDWEKHVDTAQVPYINTNTGDRYRLTSWHEEEITGYMNYSAYFKHKFVQPGHELAASLQYTKGWEDETYFINDSSSIRTGRDMTSILATEHTTSLQVDYTRPLKSGRIETGTKFQVRRLPVDFTVERGENSVIYPGLGDWSTWGENIYSGYLNFVHEKLKYDIEAGLRAEMTDVFYDFDPANIYYEQNDAYNYFKLFPNIRISYKPGQNHRFSIFYNRRVDRPGEPELRIYPKSDDQELLKVGNPYLRPQFTQSYELAYRFRWKSGSFYLSGFYRLIDDPYMRVYTNDFSNPLYDVIVKIYANTGSSINRGAEIVFSQQIIGIWKLSGNANFYNNQISAYQGDLRFPYPHTFNIEKSDENTWDIKINNQVELPRNFQLQCTGVYMAPRNIPQGRQFARSSIDMGIRKTIANNRLEINFSATDIFNNYAIRQEIRGENFTSRYENFYESQVFRIGIKYKI